MKLPGIELADVERIAAVYLPLAAGIVGGLLRRRLPRQFAACLLSVLWTAPALLLLESLNERALWWTFAPGSTVSFHAMPVEFLVGWIVLWGAVPQLALPSMTIARRALVMIALDCAIIPLCRPAIALHANWLIGEAVAVAFVLLPALCIAHWTRERTHLRARAALQLATAGLLFLYATPEIVFAVRPGRGWGALLSLPPWTLAVSLAVVLLLALPGVAAVWEFAERGHGTPIPYDPPPRLVTSGIYAYVANPMQLSCALVMIAWAGVLRSGWLLIPVSISIAYSAGLAEWDERQDLSRRFGRTWHAYRAAVRNWLPRSRPFCAAPTASLPADGRHRSAAASTAHPRSPSPQDRHGQTDRRYSPCS